MKLLLDENFSPALASLLQGWYSEIKHVRDAGLESAPDPVVWAYALEQGLTIVSKDSDFHHRSFLLHHPPRVIWTRLGNCSTKAIADLLWTKRHEIANFHESNRAFLTLG